MSTPMNKENIEIYNINDDVQFGKKLYFTSLKEKVQINGVTIQGANIKDPETFVNGLLNLKAEALQRAYSHK